MRAKCLILLSMVLLQAEALGSEIRELHKAVEADDVATVRGLLEADPGLVNSQELQGVTPLFTAACYDRVRVAKLLLSKGADVKATNWEGDTPLHFTGTNDAYDMAKLLLARGADVNAKNAIGRTPLFKAAGGGSVDTARLLIAKGATVSVADKDGVTPLHIASQGMTSQPMAESWWGRRKVGKMIRSYRNTADLLLDKGAALNVRDSSGATPLHWAARGRDSEMIALLLKRGADVNSRDYTGLTPLDWAIRSGVIDLPEILRRNGGVEGALLPPAAQ